ncbi:MAG: ribosome biogenesis GTPase YlqF [Oscillospiraceae bacterium]|nr:ribosome biogenesis GTPase YlqF [Oscillospiraceae bacterium]
MDIQWFPGHMAKTRRMIAENIRLCDCVAEIVDARCPQSSRNPELPKLLGNKKSFIIINKCDLADPVQTEKWQRRFSEQGLLSVCTTSTDGRGVNRITELAAKLMADKIEKDKARGLVNKPLRIMVCGIPNVGKSSFINKLNGKAAAKVGDRPGVTRGKQWITLKNGDLLLDTPGILWPKFDDKEAALRLAFTGAIKDDVLDVEELACELCAFLKENYPSALTERYKVDLTEDMNGLSVLEAICRRRGFIVRGGEIDLLRGANVVLDEFRSAKLGRITVELA